MPTPNPNHPVKAGEMIRFFHETNHAARGMWETWPEVKEDITSAEGQEPLLTEKTTRIMEALEAACKELLAAGDYPESLLKATEALDADSAKLEEFLREETRRLKHNLRWELDLNAGETNAAVLKTKAGMDVVGAEIKDILPRYLTNLITYAIHYERANQALESCSRIMKEQSLSRGATQTSPSTKSHK
jgi:hypothetical protein